MSYSKTVNSNINLITSNSSGRSEVFVPPVVPFVCTSTHLDDTFWNNAGDAFFNGVWNGTLQRWEIDEQTNTGAQRILTNDPVPAWAVGFRPSKLYITAYASAKADEDCFSIQYLPTPQGCGRIYPLRDTGRAHYSYTITHTLTHTPEGIGNWVT